ncbi:MAG: hypothetical protein WKG01_09605 [Kofleriaceae bacterium]
MLVALAAAAIVLVARQRKREDRIADLVVLPDAAASSPPRDPAPPRPRDAGLAATPPVVDAGTRSTRPHARRAAWPDLSLVPPPVQTTRPSGYAIGEILIAGGKHARKTCPGYQAGTQYRADLVLLPNGKAHSVEVTPDSEYGACLAKILRAGRYPEYEGGPIDHGIVY